MPKSFLFEVEPGDMPKSFLFEVEPGDMPAYGGHLLWRTLKQKIDQNRGSAP